MNVGFSVDKATLAEWNMLCNIIGRVKFATKYLSVTKLAFTSSNYDVVAMIFEYLFNAVYLVEVLTVGYKRYRLVLCCKLSCALLGYYFKTNVIQRGYHHDLLTKCIHRNGMANIEQNICSQHLCSVRV